MSASENVIRSIQSLGAARLAAILLLASVLVAFFLIVFTRMVSPAMGVLYSGLMPSDSRSITERLDASGIEYSLLEGGTAIKVPREMIDKLRLEFAADNIPTGGSIGYELFDQGSSLGATSFVQNVNQLRALQGELARTIQSLDAVRHARVHLVLPKRELFSRSNETPSASIVLLLRHPLDKGQVMAIRHLAASAVEGLSSRRVSVVDSSGRLLANVETEGGGVFASEAQQQRTSEFEQRLRRQIEQLVGSIVGYGNVRTQVTADLDFSQITETSDQYDPNGQVVRSTQTRDNSSQSSERDNPRGISIGNGLPETNASADGLSSEQQSRDARTDETVNYEISRTQRTTIREVGSLRKLSVAVLVNGRWGEAVPQEADGAAESQVEPVATQEYTALSQEDISRIRELVSTAIGIDETRGDSLSVVNMKFADAPQSIVDSADGASSILVLTKADYFQIAEILALVVATALMIFAVIRPLMRRIFSPVPAPSSVTTDLEVTAVPPSAQQVANATGDTTTTAATTSEMPVTRTQETVEARDFNVSSLVDATNIEHHLRENSVSRVGEMVAQHPEAATEIIRGWVAEVEPA